LLDLPGEELSEGNLRRILAAVAPTKGNGYFGKKKNSPYMGEN